MNILSTWILSVILSIAPIEKLAPVYHENPESMRARYEQIAVDMATSINSQPKLFSTEVSAEKNDLREAALLTSIAFFESNFRKDVDEGKVRGDHGRSWCLMQINIGNSHVTVGDKEMQKWKGTDLIKDRTKCFRSAIEVLRASMESCKHLSGSGVLSGYTTGRCIPNERTAKVRWEYAFTLMNKFPFPAPTTNQEVLDEKEAILTIIN